jgi:hypothetical protein
MCKYEDLVTQPESVMKGIYGFVGCRYPSDSIIGHVHSESKQKGKSIKLSREVDDLCRDLFGRLDAIYKSNRSNNPQLR